MRTSYRAILASVGSACLLAFAACAPSGAAPTGAGGETTRPATPSASAAAPAPAPNAELSALIAEAQKEGELSLVWAETSFGGAEGVRRFAEGFNRLYGLNTSVRFTPGPSPTDVAGRVVQEYEASRPALTDVMLMPESVIVKFLPTDVFLPVDWTWASNVQDPTLLAPGNVAVEVSVRTPGITYNTANVPASIAPKSLQDVLRPEFKGRVAVTNFAVGYDWLATEEFWGEQRAMDYVRKLADQASGIIRCGEMERVASGEFDLLGFDCGGFEAMKWQRKGAPLTSVIPMDAAAFAYFYYAIGRNAAHPANAKLWINYLLSREAQDILWEIDAQDHLRLPGSHKAEEIDRYRAQGIRFTNVDVGFFQRHGDQQLVRIQQEQARILRKQ
jgi:ABC-type Fe3+ transport system substrate-binding protein